jgi:protein transport protein SEC61 subunit gamma-like protein
MDIKKELLNIKKTVKGKLREYLRVLKIAEKPGRDEYEMSLKITGLGILIIGLVGFMFFFIAQAL